MTIKTPGMIFLIISKQHLMGLHGYVLISRHRTHRPS